MPVSGDIICELQLKGTKDRQTADSSLLLKFTDGQSGTDYATIQRKFCYNGSNWSSADSSLNLITGEYEYGSHLLETKEMDYYQYDSLVATASDCTCDLLDNSQPSYIALLRYNF